MIYAYPYLPRTGLGNMLFPWARAVVFCKETNALMIHPQWARITRIGPWMRGERYKRYYGSCFHIGDREVAFLSKYIKLLLLKQIMECDREIVLRKCQGNRDVIVRFEGMKDFFEPFLGYSDLIKEALVSIVSKDILDAVRYVADKGPYLAVHVRRGDFKQAGCLTGDAWFCHAIKMAFRVPEMANIKTVRIFSDGYPSENLALVNRIKGIKGVGDVILMPKAPAIQDILSLARSSVLVASPKSTFSMWGAFLGGQVSVWDDKDTPRVNVQEEKMVII